MPPRISIIRSALRPQKTTAGKLRDLCPCLFHGAAVGLCSIFLQHGLVCGASSGSGVLSPSQQEVYEQKIRALEERVARLEAVVARLADREPAPVAYIATHALSAPVSSNPRFREPEVASSASTSAPAAVPDAQVQSEQKPKFEMPPELVPDVGKIGAEVGLLLSGSLNPFKLNSGQFAGGFIDLPLIDRPRWLHGRLSYEISIGLSQSNTVFSTTSNVAQVANLAVLDTVYPARGLQNAQEATSGTGSAPFYTTMSTSTRLRLLEVVPFSIKYTSTVFDRLRLRPYAVLGFGTFVTIDSQNPARGTPPTYGVRPDASLPPEVLALLQQSFGGQAPFGATLVAGQISNSSQLVARGLPAGNGNIDFGLHSGAGITYRLTRDLSLGFDAQYNRIAGSNGGFTTLGSRIGFHF
jgi:hypothetical protein